MEAIKTRGLTKSYGKNRGITGLDLTIGEGEFYGFIGPNGAGKSTTIRTLLGLIRPDGGEAEVLGLDIVRDKNKILQSVGYLPSEINFYKGMKVIDTLKYSASLRGIRDTSESIKLADRLGLDLNKKVEQLSLGNRKKAGIICAVQHHPKLLIMDEPTSGLDPLVQKEFFEILQEENSNGTTVFLSSHILSEIQEYCGSAAFIKDGRIILKDKVSNLEQSGSKKVSVTGKISDKEIAALSGVAGLTKISETKMNFLYSGDIRKLLAFLSERELKDISVTEPSLEEIFMNYYKEA